MNRLTATNTAPVTQKVSTTVSSIIPQLEAMGVNHQGLAKWKTMVPMTSRINAIASAIRYTFCWARGPGPSPSAPRFTLLNGLM